MPPTVDCSHSGTQFFRMWPLGPSCFDGIRTRITPKKTEHPTVKGRSGVADTMLEKRFCQATEVKACAVTIVLSGPNMAAGGWWR